MRGTQDLITILKEPVKTVAIKARLKKRRTYTNTFVLNSSDVVDVVLNYEGDLLGTVMRRLELTFKYNSAVTESTVAEFKGGVITELVLSVSNSKYANPVEYDIISHFGYFNIYDIEIGLNEAKFLCYDDMIHLMQPADLSLFVGDEPQTTYTDIRTMFYKICEKFGLKWKYSRVIDNGMLNSEYFFPESYLINAYQTQSEDETTVTYRDILQDIAEMSCSSISVGGFDDFSGTQKQFLYVYMPYYNLSLSVNQSRLVDLKKGVETKAINTVQLYDKEYGIISKRQYDNYVETDGAVAYTIADNKLFTQFYTNSEIDFLPLVTLHILQELRNGSIKTIDYEYASFFNGLFPEISEKGHLIFNGNDYDALVSSVNYTFGSEYLETIQGKSDFRSESSGDIGSVDILSNAKTNQKSIDAIKTNNILWSGAAYLHVVNGNRQVINLSVPITTQTSGIVLVFSPYVNGEALDYEYQTVFIPKAMVDFNAEVGMTARLSYPNYSHIGSKYITFDNSHIYGEAVNTQSGTNNGVTFDNSYWVLRYVIGV